MLKNKTVFVLDAYGLLYQVFHALPPMNSPGGEPVGAVFGIAKDVFKILDDHEPDYLFCAFDLPGPTFRDEIFDKYKANRSEMPEDLRPQIESTRELLDAMGVLPLGVPGFEADDVLSTVAKKVAGLGGRCVIVSSDKDCRQLISPNVELFNLRKQSFYREPELLADWGITPEQVVDFQSLVGDASDNVPGVAKIGPKTATELLKSFGSLDDIYGNIESIAGKKKEYLIAGKENAFLSKNLVRLRDDVPLDVDWKHAEYKGFDSEKLRELFRRFGFKSLLSKIDAQRAGDEAERSPRTDLLTLAEESGDCASKLHPRLFGEPVYHLVDDEKKFEEFFEILSQQKFFSFDSETAPLDARFDATSPRYTVIVGLSFSWNDNEAWYLPFRGPLGADTLNAEKTLEKLRPILEDPNIGKIGQNLKYDIVVLHNAGVRMRGLAFDTMIADYLLHSGEMNHNLDDMAELYLHHQTIKITELIGTGKKQKRMDDIQTDVVADYAGEDALLVWRMYPILKEKLDVDTPLSKLNTEIELPLAEVLAEMEYTGIAVDTVLLKELSNRFSTKLKELETKIYAEAGHDFNVASPKQLAVVLFEELGLRGVKKTKTGQSTDIEVLEELAEEHPLPKLVVEHRQLSKLKGTYVDALPELIHPKTGRIHTSFNQVSTATGRLSSSNPNLQNIPVRSPEGKEIRTAFKPGDGFDRLLSCDYSQIELRVLAHFSGDEKLCEAFRNNEDIHTRVAAEVYGVDPDSVTSDMRRSAKAVNFGVIYGQTAFGLAKQLGIEQSEAQTFIDGYFAKYSGIRQYLESILDDCIQKGYVSTLLGRRRSFRGGVIRPVRRGGLNQAERMAINTVIQGSAADLMKQAMVRMAGKSGAEILTRSNLLLQIHDELVFEVRREDAEKLEALVVREMSLDQPLRVPLVVDSEIAEHWG